jgi:tyrosyl-tRNA synthetase
MNHFRSLASIGADTDFPNIANGLRVLWGVAPTGDIHLGYAAYLLLLRHLRAAGANVTLLIANYHAHMDSEKTRWEAIDERTGYYRKVFANSGFSAPLETKDFYCKAEYIKALFRISAICSLTESLSAGHGTLQASPENASVSDLLYIATQILDVHYLQVNAVVCGMDERPIYDYGLPLLKKHFGWECSHIFLPQCPGIVAPEMHSSDQEENKILLTDEPDIVLEKVELNYARSNSVFPLLEYSTQTLLPLAGLGDLAESLRTLAMTDRRSVVKELSAALSKVISMLNDHTTCE